MSVAKGVLKNSMVNVLQKIVRIIDQLILVPLFLSKWGAEYYGEWLTLSIIPSIIGFSDLGMGSAVSNSFVLAYTGGDKQKAADFARSGFIIISFSVAFGAIVTCAILIIVGNTGLFNYSVIDPIEAILAITMLMSSKLIGFYSQFYEGFYRAAHKAPLSGVFDATHNLLNICFGFIVLMLNYGIIAYSATMLVLSIITIVVYSWYGRRIVDFEEKKGNMVRDDIIAIIKKGIGYLASPIWQSVYFQGSTFVVRVVLGPGPVAVFNTVRTVCRSVNQLFSIINAGIFPEMQYEYGHGNLHTVQKLYRIAIITSFVIAFCGFLILYFFGQNIYNIWTNNTLSIPDDVWNVFMVGILLNAVWWTSVVVYRVTNQPYHFAILATLMAFVSVGTSYLLSLYFGMLGVAIGAVLFDAVMALYIPLDGCRIFMMKFVDLYKNIGNDWRLIYQKLHKVFL